MCCEVACFMLSAIDSLRSLYLHTLLSLYGKGGSLHRRRAARWRGSGCAICISITFTCGKLKGTHSMPNYHGREGPGATGIAMDLLHNHRPLSDVSIFVPAAHRTAACHRRCTATVTSREIPPTPVSFQARAAAAGRRPTPRSFRGRRSSTPRSR